MTSSLSALSPSFVTIMGVDDAYRRLRSAVDGTLILV